MLSVGVAPEESGDAVDTVKSRAVRADVYGVSDGHGGYQVNDPSVGVPFLPRLPEPAPRQVAEAPMPAATGLGAGEGAVQAAMPAGGVATMERAMPVGPGELPSAPAAPPRPPRRTLVESLGDFVKALPIILFALLIGGGAIVAVDRALGPATLESERASRGDTTLPTFFAPLPVFGTATFHVVDTDGGDARVTMNSDASQLSYEFLPFSATLSGVAMLANPSAAFARRNSTDGWILTQSNAGAFYESVSFLVVGFHQIVPLPLREYTSVRSSQPTVLSGHQVVRYELRFDIAAMNKDQPAGYAAWLDMMGLSGDGDFTEVTLWVDAEGIIWKGEVGISETASLFWTLEYMGPEQFVVQFPTTYFNEQTGQQVNG